MHRLTALLLALLGFTGTLLVVPVAASPGPEAEPVTTATEEVAMGSVAAPAPEAEVREGLAEPLPGVPGTAPVLTVRREGVDPFSLVGVTWAPDLAVTDTVVRVRVQDEQGGWGEWTEAGIEDAEQNPDADTGRPPRGGTAPVWTGPSTGVEVELVTRSGAAPTDVQLDLVDPGSSAADTVLGTPEIQDTAQAAMAMPDVYSRAQWGADESLMGWTPQYAPTIKAATLHHTDTGAYTEADVPAILRSIYRYHAVSRGWGDIGYNLIVDRFGRRWEGRYGGLASTVVGAHAGGFNSGTFGVAMLGNYGTTTPPAAMVESVSAIVAWKFSLFGVDPRGTTTLTSGGGGTARYAAGVRVTLPTVFAHRDVGSTTCPGDAGYAKLPTIRDGVSAALAGTLSGIASRYDADAAARAALGAPVGSEQTTAGVVWQQYELGRMYWTAATGARWVKGAILDTYLRQGGPGAVGAPRTDETCVDGGCFVHFGVGSVYWSPGGGARLVKGAILQRWAASGWERGQLGWPVTDEVCASGGCSVGFERGVVAWSVATGAHIVTGAILQRWVDEGREGGPLGHPTSDETCVPGGCSSDFVGGTLSWSPAAGVRLVKGAIRDDWAAAGREGGPLGFPTSDETCEPVGCSVTFQGGVSHWSPRTGAHWVGSRVQEAIARVGGVAATGSPVVDQTTLPDGVFVHLERGSVYWSADTGAHFVTGAIRARWGATGWEAGPLGYPTSDETCAAAGCSVTFEGGAVHWSPGTGARWVGAAVQEALTRAGGPGVTGYPVTDQTALRDGAFVHLTGGSVYWSPRTGAHYVKGAIRDRWGATGWEAGPLGYPTSGEICAAGGCSTTFSGGAVHWTPRTGARTVGLAVQQGITRVGGVAATGFPVMDQAALRDGAYVHLTGGSVYWSPGTGAHLVKGAIRDRWGVSGWEAGPLGYPTSDEVCVPGGCSTTFTGGAVHWSVTGGARMVPGAFLGAYAAAGGPTGRLGFPVSDPYRVTGGTQIDFQAGRLLLRADGSVVG